MPKRAAAETSAKPPRKRPRQEGVNDPFLISDGEEAGSAGIEVAAGAPVASSFGGELCLDGDDYEDDSQAALDRVAGLLGEGAEVEAAPAPVPASSGQASTSSTGHASGASSGRRAVQSQLPIPVSELKVKDTGGAGGGGWETHAMQVFEKNGVVLLEDALEATTCGRFLQACERIAAGFVKPAAKGNKQGGRRYSFGIASSTGSLLHEPVFAESLLGCEKVHRVLRRIFEPPGGGRLSERSPYFCISAGGDFVLAGEREWQYLHQDIVVKKKEDVSMPPPVVAVNFVLKDFGAENGPMRIVPGTQTLRGNANIPNAEVLTRANGGWRLFPVGRGTAIIRDARVLHSGSPNISAETRYLPSVEFVSRAFFETTTCQNAHMSHRKRSFPRRILETLQKDVQSVVCPDIVAEDDVQATFTYRASRG